MSEFPAIGRLLILIGFFMLVLGLGFLLLGKIGIGRLPGDVVIKKPNFTFYLPIVSSIIISLILTLLLNLLLRR
ncbi:MAG: DUF2905 domain-containing protein [candidate division WOR-3 bacterium]|nr:DUF2905 domain-containing protein [candidate division WOR-3 bacterium]MDH5682984.1 DUF2905 domain-containing protein [candidate division WOR-3 bacterium]